jgi:hypothetical protein
MYREDISKALESNNSIESLRSFAVDLNKKGMNQKEIYSIFYKYYVDLQEMNQNAQEKEDILGDAMDMITGWFVGKNLNLKP